MVLIYLQIREESIRAGGNRIKKDVDREIKTRGYKKTSKYIRRMEEKHWSRKQGAPGAGAPTFYCMHMCTCF